MKLRFYNVTKISVFLSVFLAIILILSACTKANSEQKKYSTMDDLKDCVFALSDSNTGYEPQIMKDLPMAKIDRYTNYFDTFVAVANGNADAAFIFKYTFYGIKESYPNFRYIESDYEIPIVANFSSESDALRKDFNKFIAESKENGLLEELAEKWLYEYESLTDEDIVDFSLLDGTNGEFVIGTVNDVTPYAYYRNGKLTGFEPALLFEYCKSRGYKPDIKISMYNAVVAGVAAGKYDMAMGAYGYTDERDENSHFSDPYFMDKIVYTVNGDAQSYNFIGEIKDGFMRAFIEQNRWKLYAEGMFTTLVITILSVAVGSVLGFSFFLFSYGRKGLEKFALKINDIIEALPVLVVLMAFFYVIFARSSISGTIVSIIVFGLCFTLTFFALLYNSVSGVPKEQTEAGLALGYNSHQTLIKVVLPQAMDSFIPTIRSAIVALLKGTAMVGYVAVQDLTKAGDVVRSQTFDAFFPIVAVAILYYLLAKTLIFLLNKILITPSEKRIALKEEVK